MAKLLERVPTPTIGRELVVWLAVGNLALILGCGLVLARVYHFSRQPRVTYLEPTIVADATPSPAPAAAVATDMRPYTSSQLGISLTYPAAWDVSERHDEITITSPDLTFHYIYGGDTGPEQVSKGNLIVAIGPDANGYAFGKQALVDSIPVTPVMPGSSYSHRYLLVAGAQIDHKTYFETAADTGHVSHRQGQSLGANWDDLLNLLAGVYGKYTVEAGYIHKDPGCQAQPCRDSVPWDEVNNSPTFNQALDIMKSVSFHL